MYWSLFGLVIRVSLNVKKLSEFCSVQSETPYLVQKDSWKLGRLLKGINQNQSCFEIVIRYLIKIIQNNSDRPILTPAGMPIAHSSFCHIYIFGSQPNPKSVDPESQYHFLIFSDTLLVIFLLTIYSLNTLSLSSSAIFWLYNGVYFSFIQVFHGLIIPWPLEGQKLTTLLHSFHLIVAVK